MRIWMSIGAAQAADFDGSADHPSAHNTYACAYAAPDAPPLLSLAALLSFTSFRSSLRPRGWPWSPPTWCVPPSPPCLFCTLRSQHGSREDQHLSILRRGSLLVRINNKITSSLRARAGLVLPPPLRLIAARCNVNDDTSCTTLTAPAGCGSNNDHHLSTETCASRLALLSTLWLRRFTPPATGGTSVASVHSPTPSPHCSLAVAPQCRESSPAMLSPLLVSPSFPACGSPGNDDT